MSNNGKHPKSLKKILGETFTFSTVIIRPSSTDRFRYLMQFSASSILDMVMNPNPRDSLVNGSATRWTSSTWNIEKFIHELKIVHNLNHQHRRQNTNTATKNTSQENKKFKENKRTGTYCSLSRKMLLKFSSCYSRWQTSDIQVVPRIFNVTWRAPEKQIENPQNKNKGICTYDLEKWENQTSTCFLSKKLPRTAPWPWQGPWDWSFVWWGAGIPRPSGVWHLQPDQTRKTKFNGSLQQKSTRLNKSQNDNSIIRYEYRLEQNSSNYQLSIYQAFDKLQIWCRKKLEFGPFDRIKPNKSSSCFIKISKHKIS